MLRVVRLVRTRIGCLSMRYLCCGTSRGMVRRFRCTCASPHCPRATQRWRGRRDGRSCLRNPTHASAAEIDMMARERTDPSVIMKAAQSGPPGGCPDGRCFGGAQGTTWTPALRIAATRCACPQNTSLRTIAQRMQNLHRPVAGYCCLRSRSAG